MFHTRLALIISLVLMISPIIADQPKPPVENYYSVKIRGTLFEVKAVAHTGEQGAVTVDVTVVVAVASNPAAMAACLALLQEIPIPGT